MNKFLFFINVFSIAFAIKANAQVGTNDTSFDPGTGPNLGVITTAVQTDGKILVGGGFTSYNGTAKNRIIRVNSDGSLDATFSSGTGCESTVYYINQLASGKILAVGQFTTYAGSGAHRIVRLNTDGTKDATFTSGTAANGFIYSFAEQSDNKIIIVGGFTNYNGTTRNRIARINAVGTIDATFNPGTGVNNSVYATAVQADGKVIIGGSFTTFNGGSKVRLARLSSTGSIDASFVTGTGITGTGTNVAVYSTVVQPDGKIIVGGVFTGYNGTTKNNLIRLNTDGSIDATFNTGTGPNAYVKSIALQADGKIIIVGIFTSYNGVAKSRIVRLNSDGTIDNTFGGTGANNSILACKLQPNNDLIIGGDFTTYSGDSRVRVARVHNACPTLSVSLTGNTNNLCHAASLGSATVSATGGTSFTYTWLPSGGNAAVATGLSAGTYTCIVNNECLNSASVTVTITEPTAISLTAGSSSTVCSGSNASLTSNASGGTGAFTYNWTPGNLSGANQTVSVNASTVYTVVATDANGCTATATQNVDVYTLPSVSISGGTTPICLGNTTSLTANGASSYLWNTGENTQTINVSPSSTTSYTVTGTDLNGCSGSAITTVTVGGSCATSSLPCGTTINNLNSTVNATNVTGATQYRLKIYNNSTNALISTKVQASRTFTINTLGGVYYGNTYKWTVAVDKGSGFGVESNINCNVTIAAPKTTVPCGNSYSNISAYTTCPFISGSQNYRFSFYNNTTNALVAVKTQTSNYIYFNQVPGLAYGNTYKWTVEVEYYNGTTNLFGPASSNTCTITFNPPQTTVPCGNTYAKNAYTAVSSVTGANAFRYNFYDVSTNALIATTTNTNQYIYFNQVPGLILNKSYNWTVEVRYNNGTGNVFGPASNSSCIINYGTPSSIIVNGSNGNIIDEEASARLAQQIISGENNDFWINVYPNPTKDKINITASENIKEISVYNISGELISTAKEINEIDLSSLNSGLYIISVQTDNNIKHLRVTKE